jgi:hypothetical protein
MGLARDQDSYREAVATSSPTLPLSGYVGCSRKKEDATPSGLSRMEFDTQGSRGGNPGLEVATASRYLIRASISLSETIAGDSRAQRRQAKAYRTSRATNLEKIQWKHYLRTFTTAFDCC